MCVSIYIALSIYKDFITDFGLYIEIIKYQYKNIDNTVLISVTSVYPDITIFCVCVCVYQNSEYDRFIFEINGYRISMYR